MIWNIKKEKINSCSKDKMLAIFLKSLILSEAHAKSRILEK